MSDVDDQLTRVKDRIEHAQETGYPVTLQDAAMVELWERIVALERHIHFTEIDHGWTRGPIEPLPRGGP